MRPGLLLIRRGVWKIVKQPSSLLSGFAMSLFFLAVYNAGIGGIGNLSEFGGAGYLPFLFPLTIVSLAMGSSAGAGQSLFDDMQSGYFRRLYLSPAPRWAFTAAPIIADSLSNLIMTALLLIVGALFGIPFRFGFISVLVILGLSLLWGIILSGISAGVMLRTGDHKGAQLVTTSVFPLIFLSTTFLPRELITSKWLLAISWANPVTYILEANRYLLAGTSSIDFFILGCIILFSGSLLALVFAFTGRRERLV